MPSYGGFTVVFMVKAPAVHNERLAQGDSGDRTAAGATSLMRGGLGNVGHGGALW